MEMQRMVTSLICIQQTEETHSRARCFMREKYGRAYIVGLVKGTLPADLDLIKDHIQKIQSDIDYHKKGSPISIADSGLGMDLTSISSRSSGSGGNSSMAGRSTMRHRFYRDPRYSGVPSWFILGCSRDFAEKILMEAKKLGMGNTLLREGTTHMSTGSYAISKRVDYPAGCAFEHYEVAQVAEGYKLNVQNDHQPMMCLSDIMDFFIQTSGPTTKLLTNNNLQAFMLDTPNYQSMIHRRTPAVESELVIKRFEEPACDYYNVPDCCRGEQVIEGFEEPACEYYNDPDLFTQDYVNVKKRNRESGSSFSVQS